MSNSNRKRAAAEPERVMCARLAQVIISHSILNRFEQGRPQHANILAEIQGLTPQNGVGFVRFCR